MKIKYQWYDKESIMSRPIVFEYSPPFHENMNEDLKLQHGAFLKLIDHQRRVVKLHNAYDSGKGFKIVPPLPRKPRRKQLVPILKKLFQDGNNVVKLVSSGYTVILVKINNDTLWRIVREASLNEETGQVAGYVFRDFQINANSPKRIVAALETLKFYPDKEIKAFKI